MPRYAPRLSRLGRVLADPSVRLPAHFHDPSSPPRCLNPTDLHLGHKEPIKAIWPISEQVPPPDRHHRIGLEPFGRAHSCNRLGVWQHSRLGSQGPTGGHPPQLPGQAGIAVQPRTKARQQRVLARRAGEGRPACSRPSRPVPLTRKAAPWSGHTRHHCL